jgi:hypothetical protein
MNQLLWATLNTAQTIHALVVNGVHHLFRIKAPVLIHFVDTTLLHADRTLKASFLPGDNARFGDRLNAMGRSLGMDDIFTGHMRNLKDNDDIRRKVQDAKQT